MPLTNETLALFGIEAIETPRGNVIIKLKGSKEPVKMSKLLYQKLVSAACNYSIHDIKLPLVKFGIEFEFIGSADQDSVVRFSTAMIDLVGESKYVYAGRYSHNDGTVWILGKDSSINYLESTVSSATGYELTTPAIDFTDKSQVETLYKVVSLIKTHLNGEVNKTCGTHIHISVCKEKTFARDIKTTLTAYSKMESVVFDPIVPSSRRRNRFCKPTTNFIASKYQKVSSRYCSFNHNHECNNIHYEFRQLEGTLDVQLILYWIKLHTYILCDLLDHCLIPEYIDSITNKNIFDLLFYFNFDSEFISFFIKRVIDFKSRSIQQS